MPDADTDPDAAICVPEAVVLEEDFADAGALDRFTVVAGGDWAVTGGAIEVTNPGGDGVHGNLVVHELELAGDFSIEVDCTLVSSASEWGDFSVVFGYEDADNYDYVSLNQRDPMTGTDATHGIIAVNEGDITQLLDFASTGLLTEGVIYRLRVVRTGEVIEVFRDGVSLGSVAVPRASGRRFGLGSRNDSVRFAHLVVANGIECPCVDCVEICGSGSDEDGDGASDCEDDDCFGSGCPEVCSGGLDEDGDGMVDCADSDCPAAACTACDGLAPTVSTLAYPDPVAIHWVSGNGTASWAASIGTSPLSGTAASSLSEANANARPGELVFMRGAAYGQAIAPVFSGAAGAPIVFRAYEEEEVLFDGVTNCVVLNETNYVIVAGISCYRTGRAWVEITGGSYNEIWDSDFETAMHWAGIGIGGGGHHHRIVGNTLRSTCPRTTNCPGNPDNPSVGSCLDAGGPSDLIAMRGNNILVEANSLFGGFHYAVSSKGSFNIFRSNLFHNRLHGNLGRGAGKHNNLIENNRFFESGLDREINYCGQGRDRDMPMNKQNQYGSSDTQNTIVRGNTFVGGGAVGSSNWMADILNQRIYNNTFYRNHVNYQLLGSSTEYRFDGEVFVNNISSRAVEHEFRVRGPGSAGNMICGNNFWNTDGETISLGTNDTCGASNLSADPEFVSEVSRAIESDLRLGPSSPMLDAGRWLTTVTSAAGSGDELRVADARFFTDGYGLIPGDVIQLEGDTRRVRILSVDYDSGALVVDGPVSWTSGQGVSLPYVGAAPDIGAHERCE